MNPSVTRFTRDDLRPIVEKLQSPTALLDAGGNLDTLNAAALPLWQLFHLDGSWLHTSENITATTKENLSTILPKLLNMAAKGLPLKVAGLDSTLISAVPLGKKGDMLDGYWLEWLGSLDIAAGSPEVANLSEQLAIYQDVAQAVNSSLVLEDIFESLADVLASCIPYDEAVILILDDTQNGIKLLVRLYPDGSMDISGENNAFAGYDTVVDKTLRAQQVQTYPLHSGNPQTNGSLDMAMPESLVIAGDAASALVVPLINKGMVIGLISLSSKQADCYHAVYQQLLLQVSTQLAVAVENAKLYWQTQAQASREFLINQLTASIRQSLDIDVILSTAVMELGKVLGVSRCFIRYFESALLSEIGELEKNASNEDVFLETTRLFAYNLPGVPGMQDWQSDPAQGDIEQRIFRLRKEQMHNPFILNDVRDCPDILSEQTFFENNQIKSLAVIPILIRNTLVGTITLHQCESYRSWVMEDIQLIKAMAEHLGLALHQARLFQTLDQKNKQLEDTLTELQQAQLYLVQSEKMAVLGQFVAGIAHEVNTPLGTMISNTNTLKTCMQKIQDISEPDVPGGDLERLRSSINGLLDLNKMAGERIQEIVKNLRNFARLDESELKTVDLHEGIESTLMVMGSSIPRNIAIVRNYDKSLPKIACYPGLLNQVFMNLLVNAVHALDDKLAAGGEAKVTIETSCVKQEDGKGKILVRFTDVGKGIAPENIARIFDPGFTTKGAGVGTGLGLALCYRIVEKHKGRISVESVLNQGTTFTVELPIP